MSHAVIDIRSIPHSSILPTQLRVAPEKTKATVLLHVTGNDIGAYLISAHTGHL